MRPVISWGKLFCYSSPTTFTTFITMKDNRSGETVNEVLDVHPSLLECQAQKCRKSIHDRYFLKAMGKYWHEDCLKCDLCECRLGEVDCHLYTKYGQKYCKLDYLRLFGPRGVCAACQREIKAYEMVMNTTADNVYHLECFKCSDCEKPFCVGEKYHLRGTQIICEDHKLQSLPPSV